MFNLFLVTFSLSLICISDSLSFDFKAENYVKAGEDYLLSCNYILSIDESLNYLILYKDQKEFYRIDNNSEGNYYREK